MKLATLNTSVQTNSTSIESHSFGIGDVSTIIDILRNRLYSNPIQTLTQEYLSNARDSHREAGQKRPVTVTLPTKIDSVLKVRDYGVGLNKDRVREVFVNYGISTKRSDDSQTGGFGLGAKSAWAYTDSFVVVSFYEGVRCTYVAHTGKNRNGTFELIDESATDEPNGVEVQIPVKESDIYKFVNSVYRTTMFWDVKPELKGITDIEIPKVWANNQVAFKKNNTIVVQETDFVRQLFNTGYNTNKIFVLIDGIPYDLAKVSNHVPKARQVSTMVKGNYITFISVNNGDISVAASREEISSDAANIEAINKFCDRTIVDIVDIVLDEFSNSFDSLRDYITVYERLGEVFQYHNLTINQEQKNRMFSYSQDGVKFSFDFVNNYSCDKFEKIITHSMKKKRIRHFVSSHESSFISVGEQTVVVFNDEQCANGVRSNKIRTLLGQGYSKVFEVTVAEGYCNKLKDSCEAMMLSELRYERKTYNAKTGTPKADDEVTVRFLESEYGEVKSQGIRTMKISEIEEDDTTYIIVPFSRESSSDGDFMFGNLVEFFGMQGKNIIKCGKKDYDRLVDLDNVLEYETVVEDIAGYFPIEESKMRRSVFAGVNQTLFSLKRYRDRISCPEMSKLFESYPDRIESRNLHASNDILKKYYPAYAKLVKEFEAIRKVEEKVMNQYPLLRQYYHNVTAELVYYIQGKVNAKE